MNFSMIFSAVDKATKVMGKIMSTEKKMAASMKSNAAKTDRANAKTRRSLDRTKRAMSAVARGSRKAFRAVVEGARKAGRAIRKLHDQTVALARGGIGQIGEGARRMSRGAVVAGGLLLAAYGGAAAAAGGLVQTASEFEKFQTILETTEGSAAKAEQAMAWVANFAVTTPYELDQVTESFVKLRAYGLDPTQGLLASLGDTSAAMGKPLMQAVEAVADAVTGENERLKEFGIRASKSGDMITYAYTNAAGEAASVAVNATDRMAIQQTLMQIMNEKYAGSMGRLAKTWDGMVSNLMDLWTKFQMMIMKAGLFDWMKEKLAGVLETINAMEADGSLQRWADSIGEAIQATLTNAWNFGVEVYGIFQELKGYLASAAEYVGGWKNLAGILAGIAFAPTLISTAAGLVQIVAGLSALSAALLANPIVLAVALIAGAVYLIYQNWDSIAPYFERLWGKVKEYAAAAWDWLKSAFAWTPLGMIINNWSGIKEALSDPIEKGKAAIETVWSWLKTAFAWTPGALIVGNWSGIKDALSSPVELGKAAVETAWSWFKTAFAWTPGALIISNWDSISSALSAPIETGKALVQTAWDGVKAVFDMDWMPELPSFDWEALVNLQALKDAWAAVTGWFGDAAAGLWDLIPEMPDLSLPGWLGGEDEIADPQTLLAAAEAAQKLEQQYPALTAAAQGALKGSQAAITAIHGLLSQTDFTERGVALMRTLADGIRQGTELVVAATADATQQIRDHLPSSPAKTGPLSDIHRLKFGETIAMSIRGEPMVAAMRTATAATLAAALPVTQGMAVAATAVPSSAALSDLPTAEQARSAGVPASTARAGGAGSDAGGAPSITVTYGDFHIASGTPETLAKFKDELARHKREIARMVAGERRREDRKEF